MTIAIFTEPEAINCLVKLHWCLFERIKQNCSICDSETSTNLAAILKTESRHCYNHLAVIIARENEVLDQSARAIFDNHQCNFTNIKISTVVKKIQTFSQRQHNILSSSRLTKTIKFLIIIIIIITIMMMMMMMTIMMMIQ